MPVKSQPDEFSEKVAARFRQLRKEMGYDNYEKFALAKNLNRSQYGKYEKGKDIRLSTLNRIVGAFDLTLKDFFSEGFD